MNNTISILNTVHVPLNLPITNLPTGTSYPINAFYCIERGQNEGLWFSQVTETSSAFPNTETFHRREEFCLLAKKLIRTCATKKAVALADHFPNLCSHLAEIQE